MAARRLTAEERPVVAVSVQIPLVVLAGLALGSSVVATRFGLREIPPLPLVALRLGVATLAFLGMLAVRRRPLPRARRTWWDIAVVGITNQGGPLLAFVAALQFVSSAVLAVFLALIPLFTAGLAHLLLPQERLTRRTITGLLLALAGVLVMMLTRTTGLAQGSVPDLRGQLLALGGALLTAFATVYARRHLRGADVLVVTAGQTATGLLVILPVAAAAAFDPAGVTWRGWAAVAYGGIVGSVAGFFLIFTMVRRFGATTATLPGYLMPVVAGGLGIWLLGELVTAPLALGTVLVLLGVFLTSTAEGVRGRRLERSEGLV